jgi:hypothetical protein
MMMLGETQAELVTLYDGNGLPAFQPWLSFGADTSNYLFLGDNRTSGSASVLQGPILLESNLSSVPEPSSLFLSGSLIAGFWSLIRYGRKNSRKETRS